MKIKVGNREIGEGCPPFIIAEVGSNWTSLEDCMTSITQAKLAGADAVKFQLFTHNDLYGFTPGERDANNQGYSVDWSGLKGANPWLNPEWLPKLKEKADAVGIEFMCTAFSPEGYELVNQYVNIHKVASAEANHLRILQKLRELGKPVILSTGAKSKADIRNALDCFQSTMYSLFHELPLDGVPVILMYCVAAYPANHLDLGIIQQMKQRFGVPVGYSDHSTDVSTIPQRACELGAEVLEKHFTVIPDVDTPDRGHSLNPEQFKIMVSAIRGTPSMGIGPTPEEKPMVLRHNRRLIAIKDIIPGDELVEGENFGIYRSLKDDTKALHPFAVDHVNGRRAKVDLYAGDGIGPQDFE